MSNLNLESLHGRVAIVTGGSRGIGREVCLALARAGCKGIVIAAKSLTAKPNLPGSIFTVAKEVEALGCAALPFQLDVRDEKRVEACVEACVAKWGRVDILVNNASALWWHSIENTPMKKYDLITTINSRGSFALARACMPHMKKNHFGRVVCMSPPITFNQMDGHTAYNISK
jgi:citronellol/citronellal dehydrogenase